MENTIKKIILSTKDKGLIGIIVVREYSVEKYGYGKDTVNLFEKKNELYSELCNQHQDDLKKSKATTLIKQYNALKRMGAIVETEDKVITKVTIRYNDEEKLEKLIKEYTEGEAIEKTTDDFYDEKDFRTECDNSLLELYNTYGIYAENTNDLYNKYYNLGLLKIAKVKSKKNRSAEEKEEYAGSKIKNFAIRHKVISGIAAIGALVLITTGIKGCSKNKSQNNKESSSPVAIYAVATNVPTPLPTSTPVILKEMPTVEPIECLKEIYIKGEEKLFSKYVEPESDMLIMKDVDGSKYYLYESDSEYSFENLNAYRNENLSSVGNYVQSKIRIGDIGRYIYYENKFSDYDIRDKAYVKYFSMMGNSLIKSAYEEKSLSNILNYAKLSDLEVVRLIRDDEPLCVYINGVEKGISFSELSRDAKETVLNIAWTNNLPLYKNIVSYNNHNYNQDNISDIILGKYNDLNKIK